MSKSNHKYGHILSCDDTLDSYEERRLESHVTNEMQALPLTLEGDHGFGKEERDAYNNERQTYESIRSV